MSEGSVDGKRDAALRKLKECEKDDWNTQEDAVKLFEDCVTDGDVEATWMLGMCYEYGLGIDEDQKKAMELYEKAATKGCKTAEFLLSHKEIHSGYDREVLTLTDLSMLLFLLFLLLKMKKTLFL